MKEFIFKHPIITLLLGSTIVDGVTKIVRTVAYAVTGREGLALNQMHVQFCGEKPEEHEEEKDNESSGDIQ